MANLISNTTPLAANQTWTSSVQSLTRATQIVGSVYADEPGSVQILQGGTNTNFDIVETYTVPANTGIAIQVDVIAQFFQVKYINGSTGQSTFRLFVNIMDPYGDFLAASLGPSAGGAWVVLYLDTGGYRYVGRFDGADGWNANGNAAIYLNKTGQYASFPVANATVSQETLLTTTDHTIASF